MTNITDFISAAVADKPQKAFDAFDAVIQPKLETALSAKYDEVVSSAFNKTNTTEMEVDNDEE